MLHTILADNVQGVVVQTNNRTCLEPLTSDSTAGFNIASVSNSKQIYAE